MDDKYYAWTDTVDGVMDIVDVYYQPGFVQLVSEQRLCVVNAAPSEITNMMGITTDYRTGFTDKMCIKYRMRHIVQP